MEGMVNKPEYVDDFIDMESSFIQESEKDEISIASEILICKETIENESEIAHIPNAVDSENSLQGQEQAQETEVAKTDDRAELHQAKEANENEVSPKKAEHIEAGGWKRFAKIEPLKGGGQSLPVDDNQKAVSKTVNGKVSPRKESLGIPAQSTDASDSRRESAVSKSRKFSVLSPLSRRSIPSKTDFTIVQMPKEEKNSVLMHEDSWIRVAIPYLPLWVAVLCLILNIFVAGAGTIVSGLCILCCGKTRVPPKYDQDPVLLLCVNTWVGIAQLFTVTFMLVGWFWSVAWGIRMIVLSLEHRREIREQRALQLKEKTINAFGKRLSRNNM